MCDGVLIPEYVCVSPAVVSISYAVTLTDDGVIRQESMTKDQYLIL